MVQACALIATFPEPESNATFYEHQQLLTLGKVIATQRAARDPANDKDPLDRKGYLIKLNRQKGSAVIVEYFECHNIEAQEFNAFTTLVISTVVIAGKQGKVRISCRQISATGNSEAKQ